MLFVVPPLCITREQLDEGLAIVENALELTNKKFINRFNQMEEEALKDGKKMVDMTLEETDAIWNKIKLQNT